MSIARVGDSPSTSISPALMSSNCRMLHALNFVIVEGLCNFRSFFLPGSHPALISRFDGEVHIHHVTCSDFDLSSGGLCDEVGSWPHRRVLNLKCRTQGRNEGVSISSPHERQYHWHYFTHAPPDTNVWKRPTLLMRSQRGAPLMACCMPSLSYNQRIDVP